MNQTSANQGQSTVSGSFTPGRVRAAYKSPELRVYGSVAQLTAGAVASGTDSVRTTGGRQMRLSDPRAKQNVVRVGTHPLGIGLYLFDYKPEMRDAHGHDRQLGVMADEVETLLPAAVRITADGYRMVDYGLLAQAQAARIVH